MSDAQDKELRALQAALAAEHAAVYGYGVVGGRIGERRRTEARTAYDAHRVRSSGGERRRSAAEAMREAAVRSVRWSGESVAFPGLAERSGTAPGGPAPAP